MWFVCLFVCVCGGGECVAWVIRGCVGVGLLVFLQLYIRYITSNTIVCRYNCIKVT